MNPALVRPGFARHESFQPRFGWFKKAFDAGVSSKGKVFGDEDATVRLGVGKNMVRAIRFWGIASKVLQNVPDPERPRTSLAVPTRFGQMLFGSDGWDPYLEAAGSIWLLHWALLRPPCVVPAWWVAFNEFGALEFQETDLTDVTIRQAGLVPGWSQPHPPSVKKDVDCLLRMYCSSEIAGSVEDDLDCPFRALHIVEPVKGLTKTYRFMLGHKATLPPEIVAFAVFDHMERAVSASTSTIGALASEPTAPGRVFKISEDEIASALQLIAPHTRGFSIETPAGVPQLILREAPGRLAAHVLSRYYDRRQRTARSTTVSDASVFADLPASPLELAGV